MIEQGATSEEVTITIWASPNPYKFEDSDPKYRTIVLIGDAKPYWDGAFKLRQFTQTVSIPAIFDAAPKIIESYEELIKTESERHVDQIQKYRQAIADLQCLEAPTDV